MYPLPDLVSRTGRYRQSRRARVSLGGTDRRSRAVAQFELGDPLLDQDCGRRIVVQPPGGEPWERLDSRPGSAGYLKVTAERGLCTGWT